MKNGPAMESRSLDLSDTGAQRSWIDRFVAEDVQPMVMVAWVVGGAIGALVAIALLAALVA